MNKEGVWGYPSKATKAKGKKFVNEIKKKMLEHVLIRLKRWENERRYGGPGPVALREFSTADIPLGMKLKELANWNQKEADWKMLLSASKGGNYVALHNGETCGTVTTVNYESKFSWIGMVLVDPNKRRCGIGTELLTAAIEHAGKSGPVRLDATPMGKKLYDTLGFKDEYRLTRYQVLGLEDLPKAELKCRKIKKTDLAKIINFDKTIFGAKRKAILESLLTNASEYAFLYEEGKRIKGFCFGRHGSEFEQIGPVVAETSEIARSLILHALKKCIGDDVIIDALDKQSGFNEFIQSLGFSTQRPFIRMCKGKLKDRGQPANQFAITGPELG
ncbi:MAG: GNAT family N-acetyltransferase [Lentisphaeria bacterium]|nr:GNAT family N-acetyltransferase [Lentisphaeria bacterium]